jgi:hypothetical protein
VYFVAAVILFDRLRRVPKTLAIGGSVALIVALAISAWRVTVLPVLTPRPPSDAQLLISFIREHQHNSYIVPWGFLPTLQYYFPDTSVRSLRPGESFEDVPAGDQTYFCRFGVKASNPVFSTGVKTPAGELACVER